MDTEIETALNASDKEAQYDEKAKRLLSHKYILAYILINTVDEFRELKVSEAAQHIEGEPYISIIPVEPGVTNSVSNRRGQRVVGFNSENIEINEGLIKFDIVFYVRMRDGISQMIINVEAQKDVPMEYNVVNRAVFYVSRLISSQKERDFTNTNYDDIKRVFSIWICMNMNDNSMNYVHLVNDKLIGAYDWVRKLDLLNIVLIGLSNKLPEYEDKYELHRLLGALFSIDLSVEEKLSIINEEFDIPGKDGIRKEVEQMCNLSQGIKERGITEGILQGIEKGIVQGITEGIEKGKMQSEVKVIIRMYKKGYELEQIADVLEKSAEEVEQIIEIEKTASV
ncbi:MAG: hypothetical protein HFE90_02010 [Firmicutes bacterium]|nr:hypothetical protein [Bacillota bacterium]